MGPFEYFQPKTVEEALSLLKRYEGKARVLAGGTDLVVLMRERKIRPEYVIDLGGISALSYIGSDGEKGLKIGALATIRDIERSPELNKNYSILSQAASKLAFLAIRNRATIGGNLSNAAPSADMAPPLLALGAALKLASLDGERVVPAEEFFAGPGRTALRADELLLEVQIPVQPPHTGGVYLKHGVKGAQGLAVVGVAAVVTLDPGAGTFEEVGLALGAVAPTPIRVKRAEILLKGQKISDTLIDDAARLAQDCSSPIDDVRGSAFYRREIIGVRSREAIREAIKLARGS